jgi:hypothetical protein
LENPKSKIQNPKGAAEGVFALSEIFIIGICLDFVLCALDFYSLQPR